MPVKKGLLVNNSYIFLTDYDYINAVKYYSMFSC